MEYKVLPFAPDVSEAEDEGAAVATQLQTLINKQTAEGWKFVRIEKAEILTTSSSSGGCFPMGAPMQSTSVSRFDLVVFEK